MLKLSDFDYHLPQELIAQEPLKNRDDARLLVVERKNSKITHSVFKDVGIFLNKNDLLILNDTKVLPARLMGKRATGGKVEVLLLNRKEGSSFNVLIRGQRVKLNEKVYFNGQGTYGRITAKNEMKFSLDDPRQLYKLGVMPLPPYIKRKPDELDQQYYQTVYAKNDGSIAAPTAGLHFTDELIKNLKSEGIGIAYITLHVGYSTFKPVKIEDITKHKMEGESYELPPNAIKQINETRSINNARVIPVGTTSLRTIETFAASGETNGATDLFVYPGYEFKLSNGLLTNFHLPKTTLFMLVCAFMNEFLAKKVYQEAIDKKYRFYSYGDAMLIL